MGGRRGERKPFRSRKGTRRAIEKQWAIALLGALVASMGALGCGVTGGSGSSPPPPPSPITIDVSPVTASVFLGVTRQFTANVTNTPNTAVNWAVNGVPGGNSTVGTISAAGLYTAPQNLP